jgi:uncharacterized OB-fold protein
MAAADQQAPMAVPAPVADEESRFYWDGLATHRLLVQRCPACTRRRFPPMPACPHCGTPGGEVVELGGRGTVYSWIVVHRAFNAAFAADAPYVVATVELAPGCRTVARLDGVTNVTADLAVDARFVDHDGWTELRFGPAPS